MPRNNLGWLTRVALTGWLFAVGPAFATDDEAIGFERTPPRLSYLDGEISFFRPGAPDWVPAAINTPLASGDELYATEDSNLEIQIGASAFVRAGEATELALTGLEPDFLQLRVTAGIVSIDLRAMEAGQTFEIDTPNAAFTIERSGYYRVDVYNDTTTFIARRGGRASVTLVQGAPMTLMASEEVVITGIDAPQIESYAAPELDAWDRWNYKRTDRQQEAVSTRYVPSGVYGVHDLDPYGSWRVVPRYGAIWLPSRIAVGWAPYTTGRWLYDPFYGWTWIDTAPWGWAPYHYGRWIHVSGRWAWAPGPIVARPYYAPALVAFYGSGISVGVSTGAPIGWVALGWGEPLFPWWGPTRIRRQAHWAGWGGPRVVNRVVVKNKTAIHVQDVRGYENARVEHAFVAVDRDQFGRRSVKSARIESARSENFKPVAGELDLRPTRESLAPSTQTGRRPPRERRDRPVVATRSPQLLAIPELETPPQTEKDAKRTGQDAKRTGRNPKRTEVDAKHTGEDAKHTGENAKYTGEDPKRTGEAAKRGKESGRPVEPAVAERKVRVVRSPRRQAPADALERPPFGERADRERAAPPPAPRYQRSSAADAAEKRAARELVRPAPKQPASAPSPDAQTAHQAHPENAAAGAAQPGEASERKQFAPAAERELPGVPANRVYRGRERQARPKAEEPTANPAPHDAPRANRDRRGPSR